MSNLGQIFCVDATPTPTPQYTIPAAAPASSQPSAGALLLEPIRASDTALSRRVAGVKCRADPLGRLDLASRIGKRFYQPNEFR